MTQKRISHYSPTLNKAQALLLHHDLKFVLSEYVDPLSRFYTRIALRHKDGWIPKQVLQYGLEKTEMGESLEWNWKSRMRVVREDKFELVKWAFAFSEFGKTWLCWLAAIFGKLHMLKWARTQQPPLPWDEDVSKDAFNNGHYNTLKWLVEKGCPWYDMDDETEFLRYVSVLEDEEEWQNVVVNQVIIISRGMTTLMMACLFGHTDLVCHLLACNGVNVNMDNGEGKTGLLFACGSGNLEVVKLLLEHNDIDVYHADAEGWTALHYASNEGHIEVVKTLLSHSKFTSANQGNRNGETAFYWAISWGHIEVAKAILSHPKFTNVNQVDDYGKTALHPASREGHIEVVKAILSHPEFTNANQADKYGRTALHWASMKGHIEVVKALLSHSKFTNVNEADEDGKTALHLASRYGHNEVVKALLSHSKFTSANQADKEGKTALRVARIRGHIEVANVISMHLDGMKVSKGAKSDYEKK